MILARTLGVTMEMDRSRKIQTGVRVKQIRQLEWSSHWPIGTDADINHQHW